MTDRVQLVYPDAAGHGHFVFRDGKRSIPILTRGAAERLAIVAHIRRLIGYPDLLPLMKDIEHSALPDTDPIGEVILNEEDFATHTSIVAGAPDIPQP